MFLAGLKFALGLVVGLLLVSGIFFLSLIAMDLLAGWRKRRQRHLDAGRTHVLKHVMPQVTERALFCFFFRSDDWKQVPRKTKYME
jgi:hypothetical protein